MESLVSISGGTEVRHGQDGEESSSGSKGVLFFEKKIEFHLARKQFTGCITGNSGGDFRVETLNPDAGRKRLLGSDVPGKKVDGFDFLENGLDPELTLSISLRKIGAGLENLGNTCFLNSVLQCLTYTEPLVAYLQSGKHQNSCHVAGFCALCAIQKHVRRALQSTGRSLIPRDLVSNLRCISHNFRNARQEDAHEYMVNLLESMHKCCLPSGVPSESPAAYEKSLVHKIFGGHLRSQVQCQQCLYCSNKYDPFLDLSLEIVKADTLPLALRNFTAAEMLDGGEKHYQCQQCKQKVKAKKWLTVHKAPFVLTIHLKRFHPLDPGRKVDKKVLFQCSLDMKPFVSGPYEGELKYSLYGVLVHSGPSTRSGHYVCYVRTSSGMWYLLNDNEVRQVSEKTVLDQKAYMLFYVRDRKNIAQKKPFNVAQNEDKKATANCSLANLVVKQLSKEHVDNGAVGNLSQIDCSATAEQRNAFAVSKEIPPKELSLQQDNELTMPNVDPVLHSSSSEQLTKDLPREVPFLNPDLRECLPRQAPVIICHSGTTKLENRATIVGAKSIECNEISTSCSDIQNSTAKKHVTDETSQKNIPLCNKDAPSQVLSRDSPDIPTGKVTCLVFSVDSGDKTFKVDPVKLQSEASCQNSEGSGISNESARGNSLGNRSGIGGQGIVHELIKSSTHTTTSNECLQNEAANVTPQTKIMRRPLKSKILKMHAGIKFLRWPLGLRKKKKHKKSKHRTSELQNHIKENLTDSNFLLLHPVPSTSNSLNILSVSNLRKGNKLSLRKREDVKNCNDNSQMVTTLNKEFRGRGTQNGAVLLGEQVVKSSISFSEPRELGCAENSEGDSSHCGMMSAATTVQEEMAVARWDGIELPPSESMGLNVMENHSIGYIPDEWDEEYDRGKRKKLRQSKHEFGGPNPFQEIAAKKSQFKQTRGGKSLSRKCSFRA